MLVVGKGIGLTIPWVGYNLVWFAFGNVVIPNSRGGGLLLVQSGVTMSGRSIVPLSTSYKTIMPSFASLVLVIHSMSNLARLMLRY